MDMSGEITKEPPPSRTMAAWNDDSVRSDGLRNSSASTWDAAASGIVGQCTPGSRLSIRQSRGADRITNIYFIIKYLITLNCR